MQSRFHTVMQNELFEFANGQFKLEAKYRCSYMYGSIGMKGFMNKTILFYTSYNSSPNQFFSSYGK